MSEWKRAPLGELAETQLGKMLDQKKNQGNYQPYLGNDNVQWGYIDSSEIKKMRFKDNELRRFQLHSGDLLVCEGGDPGRCALWNSSDVMYYQKALHRVRAGKEIDTAFLFYSIVHMCRTQEIRQYYTGGATIKHLPKTALNKVIVRYPSLPHQKYIAETLSAYDKLIENNRKQIKLLEEAAQRLYKEWFIDLKFSGHETTPIDPTTNLPEGWHTKELGNLVPIRTGKRDANFGSENGRFLFFTCAQKPIRADSYSFDGDAIILSGNGDFSVCLYRGKFEAYQRTYVLIPPNKTNLFVSFAAISCAMSQLANGANGSTIKYLTKRMIEEIPVICPQDGILEQFNSVIEAIQSKIEVLECELKNSQEARNRLLPKLMSGEIEVQP